MNIKNEYYTLVSAYYGIRELDKYDLKVYILKDIENYIRDFISEHPINNFNYKEEAEKINSTKSYKRKLQDCLRVLPKINASMELILLVKKELKKIDENN